MVELDISSLALVISTASVKNATNNRVVYSVFKNKL